MDLPHCQVFQYPLKQAACLQRLCEEFRILVFSTNNLAVALLCASAGFLISCSDSSVKSTSELSFGAFNAPGAIHFSPSSRSGYVETEFVVIAEDEERFIGGNAGGILSLGSDQVEIIGLEKVAVTDQGDLRYYGAFEPSQELGVGLSYIRNGDQASLWRVEYSPLLDFTMASDATMIDVAEVTNVNVSFSYSPTTDSLESDTVVVVAESASCGSTNGTVQDLIYKFDPSQALGLPTALITDGRLLGGTMETQFSSSQILAAIPQFAENTANQGYSFCELILTARAKYAQATADIGIVIGAEPGSAPVPWSFDRFIISGELSLRIEL